MSMIEKYLTQLMEMSKVTRPDCMFMSEDEYRRLKKELGFSDEQIDRELEEMRAEMKEEES